MAGSGIARAAPAVRFDAPCRRLAQPLDISSMTAKGKTRLLVFLVILVLGALYAIPKMIQGYRTGLEKGAEVRREQGR